MNSKLLLVASLTGIIVLGGVIFLLSKSPSSCQDFQEGEVTLNKKRLAVSIAALSEEKYLGLSGCKQLPENSGMLFPYESAQPVSFWMKDMLIPIDIIWIREGKVIGIEAGLPPPSPGTSTPDLPQYHSPGPVDHVLEIKSGGAGEYGIDKNSLFSQSSF